MKIYFTNKAISDLKEIKKFSIKSWGEKTSGKYLKDLKNGFDRISLYPKILKPFFDEIISFKFYRIREHLIFCEVEDEKIFVLTIIHSSRDLPEYIKKFSPEFSYEIMALKKNL